MMLNLLLVYREFSIVDQEFINQEICRLLSKGIIEPSISPWRAQLVVVKDGFKPHKKCTFVDYSCTVNLFTELDAYPLPKIETMVNSLAKFIVFSTFDLKSTYHQICINELDRPYTAFEAGGKLYQFTRIPFGITNGVAAFQRAIDRFVEEEELCDTFPYLDNITIAGRDKYEHDLNLQKFLAAAKRRSLTFNESKSVVSVTTSSLLGYQIGGGQIRPDPERLTSLQELPAPTNKSALQRVRGMFAYYAKWIPQFSDKAQPLYKAESFPLDSEALEAFESLKESLGKATLNRIDDAIPFVVECDASEVAVSAILKVEPGWMTSCFYV